MAIDQSDKDTITQALSGLLETVKALAVVPTERINVNGVDRLAEVIQQADGKLTVIIKDVPDPTP